MLEQRESCGECRFSYPNPSRKWSLSMSKLAVAAGAIAGTLVCSAPGLSQNAPWPPPAGMSAGEYLQRYGRQYNPYTGGDLRRDSDLYRALPDPQRQNYGGPPSAPTGSTQNRPDNSGTSPRREYNPSNGGYEIPCPVRAGGPSRKAPQFPIPTPGRGSVCADQ